MKLSIITINYNNVNGLRKTIDSIVSQTYQDFEWIVIDGGSTDGSKELIEQHQDRMAYWCSEPDKGVYNAMNKGIAHTHGEYINFMNSGDIFATHDALQKVFSKQRTADILYGYMMRKSINGLIQNAHMMKKKLTHYDFFIDTLGHQASFIKKSLLVSNGMYDESYRICADRKFFTSVIVKQNASYEFLPFKIAIYECGGMSENKDYEEVLRIKKEIYLDEFIKDSRHLVTNTNLIEEFWLSRKLYWLLLHSTNWYKRHFCKKLIQKYE